MSLHVSATTGCNLGCSYCYENPDRERKQEWVDKQYDIDEIMDTLEDWKELYPNEAPGLHGGEPLLVKEEHLERMFSYMHENWDSSPHIQTNGTLMNDEHVRLFKEYDVRVGISCDGPIELNRERKAAPERKEDSTESTDKMSEATNEAIDRILQEPDVTLGVITVLSKGNAETDEQFEILLDWMDWLTRHGAGGHFNPAIPYEDAATDDDVALEKETLRDRYLRTWEWMKEEPYRTWGPMQNYVDNLLGNRLNNCVNNRCDPANAGAAKIIEGDGETTGCGKTWGQYGDGGSFLQGPSTDSEFGQGDERYEALKQMPGWVTDGEPDMGGCKGCKYWNVCQGGCPGAGENDDYRNRTYFCKAKHALYERVEHDLRALIPNVRLITNLQWDAEVSELASKWQLDIKPFAAARPGTKGSSSASRNAEHEFGEPEEEIPQEALPDRTWEEEKQELRRKYDNDILTIDDENTKWHADSAIRGDDAELRRVSDE